MASGWAWTTFLLLTFLCIVCFVLAEDKDKEAKDNWKKKDVRDYSDVDVEKLYEQWEDADDEPLEEDELPEWKRPAPKIDLSKLNANDPEAMLKMSKHGRTLMMFATVSGDPVEKETESITQLWHSSLFNAHFDLQRYVVGSNRVLFVLKDGSQAWDVKNFLVKQDRCELVTIEGKDYPGKGSSQGSDKSNGATAKGKTGKSSKDKKTNKMKVDL